MSVDHSAKIVYGFKLKETISVEEQEMYETAKHDVRVFDTNYYSSDGDTVIGKLVSSTRVAEAEEIVQEKAEIPDSLCIKIRTNHDVETEEPKLYLLCVVW